MISKSATHIDDRPYIRAKATKIAKNFNADSYLDCSAFMDSKVMNVFQEAAKSAIKQRRRMNKCKLM